MNRNKGFTLIELLVVIAIIGILSSIVLASLNQARAKGADAAIKSQLSSARSQAELYYDNQIPNTYVGMCAAGTDVTNMLAKNDTLVNLSGVTSWCDATLNGYTMASKLKSGTGWWCVDSSGAVREISAKPTVAGAVCPAS